MPTSKVLFKKRAAALKLKLKRAAETHKRDSEAHEQAGREALQHAQEAADLEAAFGEEEEVVKPIFDAPQPPAQQLRGTPRPQPAPIPDIPAPAPKRSWLARLFD
jgi:hypothetical protein